MNDLNIPQKETMFGHPTGLFTLFFAELWERFSYYGMRALLVFYMIKGFMGYTDSEAYTIYGAYTALVYMTPFFGGMIADRLIGARRAVILGGLLMAGGHLMMTVESKNWFFMALALLIVGNGFFKPNISSMVGSLYPQGSTKRDAGFTIFYIGINLGAAMAPLLCGYIGETYGWHKGFGLATFGMLTGLAVFVAPTIISQLLLLISCAAAALNLLETEQLNELLPFMDWGQIEPYMNIIVSSTMVLAGVFAFLSLGRREQTNNLKIGVVSNTLTQILILVGAGGIAYAMITFHPQNQFTAIIFYLVAVVLVVAALVSVAALFKAGLPAGAGMPPDADRLRERRFGIPNEWFVYVCALVSVPIFMLFVSGFEPLFGERGGVQLISDSVINKFSQSDSDLMNILGTVIKEMSRPAGLVLMLSGLVALFYLCTQIFSLSKVPRERMFVVMILTFFSMLFWSFFEQAGSSVNNFTDRNVDRVVDEEFTVDDSHVGQTVQLRIPLDTQDDKLTALNVLSQAFLGFVNDDDSMQDQLARAVRRVERSNIAAGYIKPTNGEETPEQSADSESGEDSEVEIAKGELIAAVWTNVRPEEDSDSGEEAVDEDHRQTPEELAAEELAAQEFKDMVSQAVKDAIGQSAVIKTSGEEGLNQLVAELSERVMVEKTVEALLQEDKLTITGLTYLREFANSDDSGLTTEDKIVTWQFAKQNVGLRVGGSEVPASVFQSINPIFILIFGLVFSLLWGFLSARGMEPSTPVKFALGLIQLGLGFACFWYGAMIADSQGMVALAWLVLGYLFQTTGELCLSPVGLAMVTKLSPTRLVSTVMGTWFLATAFSQFLAAIIAQFSGVSSHGGGESLIPIPTETVGIYRDVFQFIAIAAAASGLFCLILAPILKRWMHEDVMGNGEEESEKPEK